MPLRITAHILRTTLQVVGIALLLAVVVFFGLTRTERGRDALRVQIEEQFDARFEGSLRIGELEGTLVNALYAADVRLLDPSGELVATIDSVALRPRWRYFLSRHAALGRVTLVRPRVTAVYDSTGWNVGKALTRVLPDSMRLPWDISSPLLVIEDGRIVTRRLTPAPEAVQNGYVFDYANADVRGLNGRLTIDWRGAEHLLDIGNLSALMTGPDSLGLVEMRGQIVRSGATWSFNQLLLRTPRSHVRAEAMFEPAADTVSSSQFALRIGDSRFDFLEWSSLIPALPLRDTARVRLRAHGSPDDVVVEEFVAEHGRTRLDGALTLRRLQDQAEIDVAFNSNTIDARDLNALLPGRFARWTHLGPMRVSAAAEGTLPVGPAARDTELSMQGQFDVDASVGRAGGTFQVAGLRAEPHYHASARVRDADVGRLLRNPALASDVTGRLRLSGQGTSVQAGRAELGVSLAEASLAGVPLSELEATASLDSGRIDVQALLPQAGGRWQLDALYALDRNVLDLHAVGRDADLGPLLRNDSLRTELDGSLTARIVFAEGRPREGRLTLRIDSSRVEHGSVARALAPMTTSLALTNLSAGSMRLTVGGDVLEATLEMDRTVEEAARVGALWGRAAGRAVRQAWSKPLRPDSTAGPASATRGSVAGVRGVAPVRGQLSLRVKRSDLLPLLFPHLPAIQVPMQASVDLQAGGDSLRARGTLSADSVQVRTLGLRNLSSSFSAEAGAPDSLLQTLTTTWSARADSLAFSNQRLRAPRLAFAYTDRSTDLRLRSGTPEHPGPVRLDARLDLLDDRNRLTIEDVRVALQGTEWGNERRQHIEFYRDAVVVPTLVLTGRGDGDDVQTVSAEGIVSNAARDTLFVEAQHLALHEVTAMSRLPKRVGGFLGGRLAFTGGVRRPEVTGSLDIDRLSFDNRLLGRLHVNTRYLSGTPDIGLHAALTPPAPSDSLLPGLDRYGRLERSRLAVDGTFRFPELQRGRIADPGQLDLAVNAQHVDAFFFDYIFRNLLADSRGTITGDVNVTGTLLRPLFDARLSLANGHFEVPKYNLALDASGRFRADERGIHIVGADLSDDTGGKARFTGSLLFNDYRFFSLDLHGELDEIQVMNVESARELPFYGHIWASGDLYLSGPLDNAELRSPNARTTPDSEVYIPIEESEAITDAGFILFADSTGRLPDLRELTERRSVLERPEGERRFTEGLDMRLNIEVPSGSTVHLVIDPLVGETINAISNGRIQLLRTGGDFFTYGELTVEGGDYLFSAGELLYRRFQLDPGGTIAWDGDPIDPRLDLTAFYRTRASTAGLPQNLSASTPSLIPVLVRLHITERVTAPQVALQLAIDRSDRDRLGTYEGLEAFLNQADRTAEFATSVLLTNSFLLTTALAEQSSGQTLSDTRNQFAFNSLSQLVASQLNRYLSQAIPNFDVTLGLQGQSTQDLGVTYGVALRLLDERLIIRGQGVYQNQNEQTTQARQGLEGEFVVEVRLNPSVAVEVFYRREGDVLESDLTNTTGAGLSYETQFTTWPALFRRFFRWLLPNDDDEATPPPDEDVVASSG